MSTDTIYVRYEDRGENVCFFTAEGVEQLASKGDQWVHDLVARIDSETAGETTTPASEEVPATPETTPEAPSEAAPESEESAPAATDESTEAPTPASEEVPA